MARILLLSFFVGLIGSVLAGLPAIAVMLLFGSLTAFVLVATTPAAGATAAAATASASASAASHGYHELPYTATVDPSHTVPVTEHFVNGHSSIGSVQPVGSPIGVMEVDAAPYQGAALPEFTPPTSRNLFMNVLVDEMKYHPDRPEAAPIGHPTVKQTLDDFFRIQWFSDPTDVFGKNQGQRQFVTQPSTTVPNDQGSFANWLYKIPGKTCKEGGRAACLAGTDGGPMPWMNHTS